jgi:signal transduction histidine kinase
MEMRLPLTFFAPAERATPEALAGQHDVLTKSPLVKQLLDAFPEPAMVLNRERQIVFGNDKLTQLLARSLASIVGLRPGEAFGCQHAAELPSGCGTTEACHYCGAVNAILTSQERGRADVQQCRLLQEGAKGAFDLLVWATPLEVGGEAFTVFAVRDTTDDHRRLVLERLFFHDVLNTAGGLKGILDIWRDLDPREVAEMGETARALATYLVDEIQAQRDLSAAERGDLKPDPHDVDVAGVLRTLQALYAPLAGTQGKSLEVEQPRGRGESRTELHTDDLLLTRVLGNLIKNALEASAPGDRVSISYHCDGQPTFRVRNPGVMEDSVRQQIFLRSFTTKSGPGHGLGTYSVKLLTERYLGGSVRFTSRPGEGTEFVVTLPTAQ